MANHKRISTVGIESCSTLTFHNKKKITRFLVFMVSFQIMLILYGLFYLNSDAYTHVLKDDFRNEWHELDNKTVFRSESAFYFTQKNLITIIFASIQPKNSLVIFSCVE